MCSYSLLFATANWSGACGRATVPAELTRIGERGSSMALSAYSAVMLRKMLPVHTNRMDGIVFTSSLLWVAKTMVVPSAFTRTSSWTV